MSAGFPVPPHGPCPAGSWDGAGGARLLPGTGPGMFLGKDRGGEDSLLLPGQLC